MLAEEPHLNDEVGDTVVDRQTVPRLVASFAQERLDGPSAFCVLLLQGGSDRFESLVVDRSLNKNGEVEVRLHPEEAHVLDKRLREGKTEVGDAALLDRQTWCEFDELSFFSIVMNRTGCGHLLIVGAEVPAEARLDFVPGAFGVFDP